MSPDFYIRKYLRIEHKNGVAYYELSMERGYFFDYGGNDYGYDSDGFEDLLKEELNNKLYMSMINYCLTPRKDVIIYENNEFINDEIKEKYLPLIENKINGPYDSTYTDDGTFSNISEIIRITKCEHRYD